MKLTLRNTFIGKNLISMTRLFVCFVLIGGGTSLAQSQTPQQVCRRALSNLFNYSRMDTIRLSNCEKETAGCKGCAKEKLDFQRPTVSLNSRIVSVPVHIVRTHVWGHCPGTKWNNRPDPQGPIDATMEVSYRIVGGRIKIGSITEKRSKPKDRRPSWATEKAKAMIRVKNNTPVDCPNTN